MDRYTETIGDIGLVKCKNCGNPMEYSYSYIGPDLDSYDVYKCTKCETQHHEQDYGYLMDEETGRHVK